MEKGMSGDGTIYDAARESPVPRRTAEVVVCRAGDMGGA